MGVVTCTFCLGKQTFTYNFIVLQIWQDHLYLVETKYKIGVQWPDTGERMLTQDKHIHARSVETTINAPKISPRSQVEIPGKTIAMMNAQVDKK